MGVRATAEQIFVFSFFLLWESIHLRDKIPFFSILSGNFPLSSQCNASLHQSTVYMHFHASVWCRFFILHGTCIFLYSISHYSNITCSISQQATDQWTTDESCCQRLSVVFPVSIGKPRHNHNRVSELSSNSCETVWDFCSTGLRLFRYFVARLLLDRVILIWTRIRNRVSQLLRNNSGIFLDSLSNIFRYRVAQQCILVLIRH